jgi:hypothetical protein
MVSKPGWSLRRKTVERNCHLCQWQEKQTSGCSVRRVCERLIDLEV